MAVESVIAWSIDAPDELIKLLKLSERREPAVVDIAVWVALAIIQGQLRPGQDLNSVDLASRFGTSRTPVREALALLESEGLVEMRARRRPRVPLFSLEQIREIFFVRAELLAALAEVAVERVSEHDIALLRSIMEVLRQCAADDDDSNYLWAHFRYFDAIAAVSGNDTARGILNSLFLQTLPVRRALSRKGRLAESLYFAEAIFDAVQRGDGQLAALLVRRSIQAAIKAIENAGYLSAAPSQS
ncbi:GntR family transcriptional regulator [Dactylosporangium sp. CA-233914]|uniref:GntR family transcriptional regulator n=1 Tax=Dactylosporangium sp. CA-233914 TaxID=3239934 RepID=UPI003D941404